MDYAAAAQQEASAVYQTLGTKLSGLSPAEAMVRLVKDGPNELPERQYRPWWQIVWHQFRNPLIWLMGLATLISVVIGEEVDAAVILFTTLLNITIGAGQELQSERILADLRNLAKPRALVQREGISSINADKLVIGDIVLLEEGSRVPADGRLVISYGLAIDESTFTGESLPVSKQTNPITNNPELKQAINCVFMGTIVTHGRGTMVVIATGQKTELGQLAQTLEQASQPLSPLGEQVGRLTSWLVRAILVALAILLFAGWINHLPTDELLLTAISVAVAALPEGLPLLVTIVLVFGIKNLARHKALVRRTEAVETLGQVQILMTDKTGTLTKNQLKVSQLLLPERRRWRVEPADTIRATDSAFSPIWNAIYHANGASASDWNQNPDPIDRALMGYARQWPLERTAGRQTKIGELPFDSTTKIMAAVYRLTSRQARVYLKGSPDSIIKLCGWLAIKGGQRRLTVADRRAFRHAWQSVARNGEKLIATAQLELTHSEWESISTSRPAALKAWQGRGVLSGAVSFADELRPEAAQTVADAQAAGVRVVMVTGDNKIVASAIGQKVGLRGPAVAELPASRRERRAVLDRCDIYADVTPKRKLELVKAWQQLGFVVSMTGDGVNDTPALAAADCGLALGSTGTDLAKDAADIVILNDNLATVIRAIGQGRTTFRNVQRVIAFLISTNLSELSVLVFGTLAAGAWPLPLLPIQLLWINLVTDSFSVIPLAIEPDHEDTMSRPPRRRSDPIISPLVAGHMATATLASTIATVLAFGLTWRWTADESLSRTMAFTVMVGCQLMTLLATRSFKTPLKLTHITANPSLSIAFVGGWLLQITVVSLPLTTRWLRLTPLSAQLWFAAIFLTTLPILALEIRKRGLLRNPQATR